MVLIPAATLGRPLDDGFESGVLLGDGGQWTNQQTMNCSPCSLTIDPQAAKVGDGGLRFVDADGSSGRGATLRIFCGSPGVGPGTYLRFWLRVVNTSGSGGKLLPLEYYGTLPDGGGTNPFVGFHYAGAQLELTGWDNAGNFDSTLL